MLEEAEAGGAGLDICQRQPASASLMHRERDGQSGRRPIKRSRSLLLRGLGTTLKRWNGTGLGVAKASASEKMTSYLHITVCKWAGFTTKKYMAQTVGIWAKSRMRTA